MTYPIFPYDDTMLYTHVPLVAPERAGRVDAKNISPFALDLVYR
jgi:hypothetical protein